MAGSDRNRTNANSGDARQGLARVRYMPAGPNALNLEVMTMTELRRRVSTAHLCRPQRIEFHLLMVVTRGRCTHWVDFVANECRARSWIIVRPGQVQRFDPATHWDGWIVLFQPQFLLPRGSSTLSAELASASVDALPNHLMLDAVEHDAGLACIGQMSADSGLSGPDTERHALLRHQLHALLLRLQLSQQRLEPEAASASASPRSLLRFQRFRDAVSADFARVHQVRDYARRLGYSEKSLTRSTLELAGVSAKAFVSQRIALEARRLLAHTSLPVSVIAAQLGMDEANNFAKFFKREVGCTPTEFRVQQGE